MSIKRINEFPEGSGSLSNDDVFLFMDNPSGGGTTKKISLSQIEDAIGGGGNADTGDITFDSIKIIGSGTGSGDGSNKGTIELVPDNTLYNNDQYLIVDPTGPNHIHLRAGGPQDDSNAELILGGEHANVRALDWNHSVYIRAADGGTKTLNFTGRNCASYGVVDIECPGGSTFEYQGAQYSITTGWDTECNNGWLFSVTGPVPSDHPDPANFESLFDTYWDGKTVTAQIAFTYKDWTFGNDGILDLAGGIRFPNNTTQTSAGVTSNTGLVPNSVSITNMVSTSQANYDAITTKDPNTLYIINS
jgi:hypothetical protein